MKKIVAALLSVVMAALLFTGCTTDELGFYSTIKSMNALKNFAYSGTVSIKVPTLAVNTALPSSSSSSTSSTTASSGTGQGDTTAMLQRYKELLNNASISYNGIVDYTNSKVTLQMNITLGNGTTLPVGLMVQNKNGKPVLDITTLAAAMLPSGLTYTSVTIDGTQYNEYDIATLTSQLSAAANTTSGTGISGTGALTGSYASLFATELKTLTNSLSTSSDRLDMQKKSQTFIDNLMNSYFKKLSLGLIKKSGSNGYTCSINAESAIKALQSTLTFVSKNSSALKTQLVKYVNSLTDSEVAGLGVSGIKTKKALAAVLQKANFATLATSLAPAFAQLNTSSLPNMNITFGLTQVSSNSYKSTSTISLDNTNIPSEPYFINMTIDASTQING